MKNKSNMNSKPRKSNKIAKTILLDVLEEANSSTKEVLNDLKKLENKSEHE